MPVDFIPLLQASPALGVAIMALYFINIISKRHTESMNKIVATNTKVLVNVTKSYSKVTQGVAVKLEKITDSNNALVLSNTELKNSNMEFKQTLEKIYIHNMNAVKEQASLA